jgi:hypothetical protein
MGTIMKLTYILLCMNVVLITPIIGLVKFTIPKTDVIHPKSGLILHYVSEYRPANKIITFTVTLPMYSDMCYLIPHEAMGKIPECNDKEATIREIRSIQAEEQQVKTLIRRQDELRNRTLWLQQEEMQKNKTMLFVSLSQTTGPTTTYKPKTEATTTVKSTKKATTTVKSTKKA